MSRTTAREVAMMMHFSNLLSRRHARTRREKAESLGALDAEDLLYVSQMLECVGAHTRADRRLVSRYSKDWAIDASRAWI
jgi:transcription termination factor NusB